MQDKVPFWGESILPSLYSFSSPCMYLRIPVILNYLLYLKNSMHFRTLKLYIQLFLILPFFLLHLDKCPSHINVELSNIWVSLGDFWFLPIVSAWSLIALLFTCNHGCWEVNWRIPLFKSHLLPKTSIELTNSF